MNSAASTTYLSTARYISSGLIAIVLAPSMVRMSSLKPGHLIFKPLKSSSFVTFLCDQSLHQYCLHQQQRVSYFTSRKSRLPVLFCPRNIKPAIKYNTKVSANPYFKGFLEEASPYLIARLIVPDCIILRS